WLGVAHHRAPIPAVGTVEAREQRVLQSAAPSRAGSCRGVHRRAATHAHRGGLPARRCSPLSGTVIWPPLRDRSLEGPSPGKLGPPMSRGDVPSVSHAATFFVRTELRWVRRMSQRARLVCTLALTLLVTCAIVHATLETDSFRAGSAAGER